MILGKHFEKSMADLMKRKQSINADNGHVSALMACQNFGQCLTVIAAFFMKFEKE